jgi:hypothetical protein
MINDVLRASALGGVAGSMVPFWDWVDSLMIGYLNVLMLGRWSEQF